MTPLELEQLMESRELPESDREELRTMQEFLSIRKERKPMSDELKSWLRGEDSKQ